MRISIVIPAYNEEKYIGKTLESIKELKTDGLRTETIVVDDGSTDKTAQIARSFKVRFIRLPHKGISFARQAGLKTALGEIIATTDADTVLPSGWLIEHIAALRQSGVVLTFGVSKVMEGGFPYFYYTNYLQVLIQKALYLLFSRPMVFGQNMAFWKRKALAVGGYNIHLKVMEDFDLAYRMQKLGRIEYLPEVEVYASGRRAREGIGFFSRSLKAELNYFSGKAELSTYPCYR